MSHIDPSAQNVDRLDLFEIERLSLAANNRAAQDIPALEEGLTIPEEDLTLFFSRIPGRHVLDLGCGWGRYASRFAEAKVEYLGVDYSSQMLVEARKANPTLSFLERSYHDLGFADDMFDGIWACCIFGAEPKKRVPEALTEIKRVLRPGGILFIVLPNIGWSSEEMEYGDPRFGPMYHSLWYPEEFKEILEDQGFSSVEAFERTYCGSATFIAIK